MNTDSFALEAMARGAGVRVRCPASASSKRAFDVVISAMLLVIFAPLLLLAALAVATEGEGVLFRQRRTGLNGHVFTILKFRTMTVAEDGGAVAHARPGDPRVTRIGAILRATSLDELPQLINVLRGEMSLVGPRPIVIDEAARYGRRLADYCAVRPGLTGLWQVSGRNAVPYPRRVAMDVWLVRNRSIGVYLAILARTVPAVLSRRGVS